MFVVTTIMFGLRHTCNYELKWLSYDVFGGIYTKKLSLDFEATSAGI